MTKAELEKILAAHAAWCADPTKGARANLARAYLEGANLEGAYLVGASLG